MPPSKFYSLLVPRRCMGLFITVFVTTNCIALTTGFHRNSSAVSAPMSDVIRRRTGKAWSVPFNTDLLKQQYSAPLKKTGDSVISDDDSFTPSSSSLQTSHQTAYSPEAYGKPLNKAKKYSYSYLYPQDSNHKPTFSSASEDSSPSTASTTESYPAAGYFSTTDLKNHRLVSSPSYKGSGLASPPGVKFPSKSYEYSYDYSKYSNNPAHYQTSNEYGYHPNPSSSKSEDYQNTGSSMSPSFTKPTDSHRLGGYYPHSEYLGGRYSASTLQSKKANKLSSSLSAQHVRPHHTETTSDERPEVTHEFAFRDELDGMYGDAPPPGYPLVGFIERDDHEYHPLASHKYTDKYHPHPHIVKYVDYLHHHVPYHHHHPHKKSSYSGFGLLLGLLPLGLLAATLMPSLMAMPVTVASGRKKREAHPEEPVRVLYNHPVLDKIARYGMTSLDDPQCLQQIFCEITMDGKTNKSNVVQKVFYKLVSWTTDDVADKLGMKLLVRAVKQEHCELFHCSDKTKDKKEHDIVRKRR